MKPLFSILLLSFIFTQSDCIENRYINEIFETEITYNIEYGSNTNENIWGAEYTEVLYMDVYEPQGDVEEYRPLIFFLFGGSFVSGSKSDQSIVALCTSYAKKGYVAVAIDYRVTQSLILVGTEENAYYAVMKAIHDLKAAIRYFRMDDQGPNTFRIDSDRIYAGGVSAGSITTVNAAYLDRIEEVPSHLSDMMEEQGGLEGLSGNEGYDSNFHGVVNLCGAVGDYNWIEPNDTPIVSMHNSEDSTVPYSDEFVSLFGLNMQVYGSQTIHQTMTDYGNYSELHTYPGSGHCSFPMSDILSLTSSFMYELVCAEDTMLGDVNNDGIINILDIVQSVNIIMGTSEYSSLADLNADQIVNVLDIILLVNMVLHT